jgi:hypothetical protein
MLADSIVDWLNENEYRGYPLRENTARTVGSTNVILDSIILDASFIYINNPLPETVKLTQIVVGTNITVTVTDQPSFVFPKANTYPVYIRNSEGSLLVIGETVATLPNATYSFPNTAFEDCVSSEYRDKWLGVSKISFPDYPNIAGDQNWEEGYQFKIQINNNTIGLGASNNYGTPISCQNFFEGIFSNDCDDIISTINGAQTITNPDVIRFDTGPNVIIFEDPPNHRLYIGLNFNKEDVCKNPLINPT